MYEGMWTVLLVERGERCSAGRSQSDATRFGADRRSDWLRRHWRSDAICVEMCGGTRHIDTDSVRRTLWHQLAAAGPELTQEPPRDCRSAA